VGRDIRDNSPRLPSVLVSELLDTVEHCYGEKTRAALITEHPMQPFNARNYLDRDQLFSYAADWLPSLLTQQQETVDDSVFIRSPLPKAAEPEAVIELDELIRFFTHPSRAFLQQRLGIHFGFAEELLDDSEPFELDYLQQYGLRQELLESQLQGQDKGFELLRARGELPATPFDALNYEELGESLQDLVDHIHPLMQGRQDDIEVDLALGDLRINGWLRNIYQAGLLRYRPARVKARDLLRSWLEHLVLNCHALHKQQVHSHFIGKDQVIHLTPVANAEALLLDLIELYQQGMQLPLHFYPETSWAQVNDPKKVEGSWNGNDFMGIAGEGADPYTELALRGQDALDEDFEQLAQRVYAPLLEHMEAEDA
jgi:exodeoxyribonuclease V gamma subunit